MLTRLVALFVMTGAIAAAAQDAFPQRPIKLVLPFAASGGTDVVARLLAQHLTQQIGSPVVVENKAGANGNIGAELVAKAAADGYTILYNTSFVVTNPWLYPKLPYDTMKDFAPVILSAKVPLVLVAHPSVPADSLQEFIAYAKANSDRLSYASSGIGGSTHLANLLFQRAAGISATHVPYRGGGPAMADLLAGAVQFYMDTANTALPHIKAGKIKALAVSSRERLPDLPDIPTVAEAVQPDFEVVSWQGVLVPAKTPAPIIARLNAEFRRALLDPTIVQKLAAQAASPIGSTPDEYREYLIKESALWKRVISEANVRLE